ncbi:MAG: hypothetical protein Kow0062_14100 [Acidobacteriota bacterium]
MNAPLDITPETKVGELLDAHPELLDALLELSPAFGKLRNPVLRRTVARFASLADAARLGGIPVPELVGAVRRRLGLPDLAAAAGAGEDVVDDDLSGIGEPRETIDGDAELAEGRHPLGRVLAAWGRLGPGESIALTTAFRPEPLIAELRRRGARVACRTEDGRCVTVIARPQP